MAVRHLWPTQGGRVVHHHPVPDVRGDRQVIGVPAGSAVVSVGVRFRHTQVVAWIEKPADAQSVPTVGLSLFYVPTGQPFDLDGHEFAGTVFDGPYRWHVYAAFVEAPPGPGGASTGARPWWEVLEVPQGATPDLINSAWRDYVRQAGGDQERLKELNAARDQGLAARARGE